MSGSGSEKRQPKRKATRPAKARETGKGKKATAPQGAPVAAESPAIDPAAPFDLREVDRRALRELVNAIQSHDVRGRDKLQAIKLYAELRTKLTSLDDSKPDGGLSLAAVVGDIRQLRHAPRPQGAQFNGFGIQQDSAALTN